MDNTEQFSCVSLCSGYEGIGLGLERVIPNLRTVAYVEVEAFAVANLVSKIEAGKLDAAPIWTDIKTFDGRPFRDRVHIITGGYPCQPFSVAGKRQGTDDPRHLWPYIERIIEAVEPVWCFFENVGGHLSIGFPEVYRSLRLMGYSVEAGLFTAAEVGSPHKRERLFILAHSGCSQQRGIGGNGEKENGFAQKNQKADRRNQKSSSSSKQLADSTQQSSNGPRAARQTRGNEYTNCRWPSRPGQPQYEWEEPRVVENTVSKRSRGKGGNAEHEGRETSEAGRKGLSQDSKRRDGIAIPDNQSTGGDGASEGQTKPRLGRAANGPSSRVDRLKLLGNGVVPQCAELAFRTLIRKYYT